MMSEDANYGVTDFGENTDHVFRLFSITIDKRTLASSVRREFS